MKRITAMLLVVMTVVLVHPVFAQDSGYDLGIPDCYPPTIEYLQTVMPDGMPVFAFYNECGVLNMQLPFSLIYASEISAGAWLSDREMAFDVEPFPVLTGSWDDTNASFLDLGEDAPGGRHGLELVNTTAPQVTVGLIHTYYNPANQILMGEPLRLLYRNMEWQVGQTLILEQEIDGWLTTVELTLETTQIIQAGVFHLADQVNGMTGRISIDLATIGYQPLSAAQTILFVGCYESASDWFGNRVLFSFVLESIQVEQIN